MKNLTIIENEKRELLKAIERYQLALKENCIFSTSLDIEKIKNQIIDSTFILNENDYKENLSRFIVEKDDKKLNCYTYGDGVVLVEGYYCVECKKPLRLTEVVDGRSVCECGCF